MNSNSKLIINTLAQNIRTLLNILMSLYSTRIALQALGQSDYGIYMLVAGVVGLLSYFINAFAGTTQRHISFAHGQGVAEESRKIFANSYLLQWGLGGLLSVVAVLFTSAIFDYGFLNVPADRIAEAKYVYLIVVTSVFFSFLASTFRALLIAYENIVYISIVDVLDGALKLALVFLLFYIDNYQLSVYATIISSIQLFNLILLAAYCKLHYRETILVPYPKYFSATIMKRIVNFAVWKLYETMSIFLRNQGVAVVFNRKMGTIINAAYGVASQVYGSIQFFSEAILNAMRPQIIQAEGNGERERMLHLSECACRYCFFMLALISIPIIFEIPTILEFWLAEVPDNSVVFCRAFLIAALTDQLTIGLGVANNAIGRIRNYTLTIFTVKISVVAVVAILLSLGYGVPTAMFAYIIIEMISSVLRLPMLKYTAGLSIIHFFENVIVKLTLPVIFMILAGALCNLITPSLLRVVLTGVICVMVGAVCFWYFGTLENEKEYAIKTITNKIQWKK